mgnify:CR=1 FL=1
MMNYTEKEQSMKTLKEVACGQTVKVKKLTGEIILAEEALERSIRPYL